MSQIADTLDLGTLDLRAGEGRQLDLLVRMAPFDLGGQRYSVVGDAIETKLDVSRTLSAGYALRLRFDTPLEGPCMRCLEPAGLKVAIDAHEVEQSGDGEELHSPYLSEEQLDLAAWAHDALMLELPAQIVCKDECLGLCAVCGQNLNEADPAEHQHDSRGDPRWAKLKEWKPDS